MRQFTNTLLGDRWRIARLACVVAAFSLALFLRTAFNYSDVFADDGVGFWEGDALFHMRTVHNLVHNFPWRTQFDPYATFPDGMRMPTAPLFDYLIATASLIVGFGRPTPELIDTIGAWAPSVFSALTVLPIYLLTRLMFGPLAACFAALLVAVLPGTFATISRLGFSDHHSLEVLLAISTVWLLTRALVCVEPKPRLAWSCFAGLALAGYLSTRAGGAWVVAALLIWAAAQIFVDGFHGRSAWRILALLAPVFGISIILAGPVQPVVWGNTTVFALAGGIAGLAALSSLAWVMRRAGTPPWSYPATFVVAGLVALCVAILVAPDKLTYWAERLLPILGDGPAQSVRELQSTLKFGSEFSVQLLLDEFGTTIVFAAPLIPLIWRRAWQDGSFGLLWFWAALMLGLGLAQVRMVPFAVVALAPFAGLFASRALALDGRIKRTLAFCLVCLFVWMPNIRPAVRLYDTRSPVPPYWKRSFEWLRTQTPEPFNDPQAYNRWYADPKDDEPFEYPESAYGVLAWWDFGYPITTLGRRIPTTTGTQANASQVARFYSETQPAEAQKILKELGVRYVVVDHGLLVQRYENWKKQAFWFYAIIRWASRESEQFYELYYERDSRGKPAPIVVYYPDYYRTMMARLYLFDGKPAEPANSTWAIKYKEFRVGSQTGREIVEQRQFKTLAAAEEFLAKQTSEDWVLAGLHSSKTCVPVEGVSGYERRFKATRIGLGDVKIFEVMDHDDPMEAPVGE